MCDHLQTDCQHGETYGDIGMFKLRPKDIDRTRHINRENEPKRKSTHDIHRALTLAIRR
ncbi:hypothetical protein RRSWK_03940 [Rhodopirellula sp. SWK7]|nr:hypothetical protein RRSWK_03940 [Rhodopirellula sp. SWK7]